MGEQPYLQQSLASRIGTGLPLQVLALMTSLTLVIIAIADTASSTITRDFSERLIQQSLDGVESRMRDLFSDIEGDLRMISRWWQAGEIHYERPSDIARLNSRFVPLLDLQPAVTSMMLAHDGGFEYLLLRAIGADQPHDWYNRIVWRDRGRDAGGEWHWQGDPSMQSQAPAPLSEALSEYDPRERRFYKQAPLGEIAWTRPNYFFVTRDAGMSASYKWRDPASGQTRLVAFDLLLRDLSRISSRVRPSQNGKVFVLSERGDLIGLPADSRWANAGDIRRVMRNTAGDDEASPAPDSDARLPSAQSLQLPIIDAGLQHWRGLDASDRRTAQLFKVRHNGDIFWVSFRPFELGRQQIWLGAILPRSDIVGLAAWERRWLLYAIALVMAVAILLALIAARRLQDENRRRARAERNLSNILESTPDAMFIIDRQGHIVRANQRSRDMLGLEPAELPSRRFDSLLARADRERLQETLARLFDAPDGTGLEQDLELNMLRVDGQQVAVDMNLGALQTEQGTLSLAALRDVTVRREAQRRIAEADERVRQTVQNVPGAVFRCALDDRFHLLFISDAIERLTGYSVDQIMNDLDRSLLSLVHPDDRERIHQVAADSVASGQSVSVEYRLQHADGSRRWALAQGRVQRVDGKPMWMDGTILDISAERRAQRQAEAAIREAGASSRRLAELTRNLPGTTWRLVLNSRTRQAQFTEFTGHFEKQFHRLDLDAIRKDAANIAQWVHPDDRDRFLEEFTKPVSRTYSVAEYRVLRKPDQWGWLRVYSSRFESEDSDFEAAIGYIADVDAEKQLLAELAEARAEADRANAAKSEFLANISHEIRTPMNAITGMAHLIAGTQLDKQQRHYLNRLERASRSLLRLLNDVLDFSKIEAGRLDIECIAFDLDDLLDAVSSQMAAEARGRVLKLIIDVASDCPTALRGDPYRLEQILRNLASNAVKFTPDGGDICLRIATVDDPAGEPKNACRLRFEMADTGIGLPEGGEERLFQSFSQLDNSITRRYGGTGLGLAICKQLVTRMGGEIGVSRRDAGGSCFWFELPLDVPPDEATAANPPHTLTVQRALLLEDHDDAAKSLAGILRAQGVDCEVYDDGEQLLNRLAHARRDNQVIDLLLLDWQLPTVCSLELTSRLDASPERYGRPLRIFLTTLDSGTLPERAGAQATLMQPVTPASLTEALGGLARQEPDTSTTKPAQTEARLLDNCRVLLVEDNDINQEIARGILESAGARVTIAGNGQAALDTLASVAELPHMVLMDCQMPLMSGYEATRQIRQQPRLANLPVIAMTAHGLDGDRQRCLDAGMNEHLAKPVEPQLLLQTVATFARRTPATGSAGTNPNRDEPPAAPPRPDGFDTDAALARSGGDSDRLHSLFERFAQQIPDWRDQLQAHMAEERFQDIAELAHHIRGVAANLGGQPLADAARQIEGAAGEGRLTPASLEALDISLLQAEERIQQALSAAPSSGTANSTHTAPSRSSLGPELDGLRALLDVGDTASLARIRDMQRLLPPEAIQTGQKIERACRAYDFPAALLALSELEALLSASEYGGAGSA